MNDTSFANLPPNLPFLENRCQEIGFTMPSDRKAGALLRTLAASKPGGNFLELGTGIGLSLAWLVDGMNDQARIVSIDNDPKLTEIVSSLFSEDARVRIVTQNGENWVQAYQGPPFDLIFADAWPGKYEQLEATLDLLKVGGFYVIDDMLPQPNWPKGHASNAATLVNTLEQRKDLLLTKISWSTGVLLATKVTAI